MRKGRDGEKRGGGQEEKNDENSGLRHCQQPTARTPHACAKKKANGIMLWSNFLFQKFLFLSVPYL